MSPALSAAVVDSSSLCADELIPLKMITTAD
jgi:hypothetical protein